ncbi:MAG: hypothetical protein Q4A66_13325, partial [Eubacteriales bacterium]|nr:hypothetical protein [Eubacteriales bacterium]
LSAAMLAVFLPSLLALKARRRRLAVLIFALLFGALLALGVLICRRHYPAVCRQALPFVYLSRGLPEGYPLVAACLYAAALSTLLAMLAGLVRFFPRRGMLRAALLCLLFALLGFERLVAAVYPALGALSAGLLLLLCFAPHCKSMSVR